MRFGCWGCEMKDLGGFERREVEGDLGRVVLYKTAISVITLSE